MNEYTCYLEPSEIGGFVVYCPDLDIATQGETQEEALTNIHDAIAMFIDTLKELGDLDAYLEERGLRPVEPIQ